VHIKKKCVAAFAHLRQQVLECRPYIAHKP
jgi:hypothetical protein